MCNLTKRKYWWWTWSKNFNTNAKPNYMVESRKRGWREWGSRQTNQQKSAKNQDALNSIPSGLWESRTSNPHHEYYPRSSNSVRFSYLKVPVKKGEFLYLSLYPPLKTRVHKLFWNSVWKFVNKLQPCLAKSLAHDSCVCFWSQTFLQAPQWHLIRSLGGTFSLMSAKYLG